MISNKVINKLEQRITDLKYYITYNTASNNVLRDYNKKLISKHQSLDELHKAANDLSRKKVFEYNSCIISLYGIFERYIEDLMQEYLESLCNLYDEYYKMPNSIRNNYVRLCTSILNNIENPKYSHLTEENVVKKLNLALNKNVPILNTEAFEHHIYNFKQRIVHNYFKKVGINNINGEVYLYSPLKGLVTNKFGNRFNNIPTDILYQEINELSSRRNDVAHGVEGINILSHSYLNEMIRFVLYYSKSLFKFINNCYTKNLYNYNANKLDLLKVYNNRIVCFKIENTLIEVGDNIIIKKPAKNRPQYEVASITTIEINGKSIQKCRVKKPKDVAFEINKKAKDNYTYKYM